MIPNIVNLIKDRDNATFFLARNIFGQLMVMSIYFLTKRWKYFSILLAPLLFSLLSITNVITLYYPQFYKTEEEM